MKYHNKQRRPKKKYRIGKCYNSGVHGHIKTSCTNREIKLSHQKEQKKENPHQVCRNRRSPSNRYNSYCIVIASHPMTLAIGLLTAWHMRGISIGSTEYINIFLISLVTLDVLYVTMLDKRRRITIFPCVTGEKFGNMRICKANNIRKRRLNR